MFIHYGLALPQSLATPTVTNVINTCTEHIHVQNNLKTNMAHVTYAVALKAPKGRLVQCISSSSSTWTFDPKVDIDGWVTTQLTKFDWTGWLLYNDEAPEGETELDGGHCKGILAWNDTTLGWMIHSVPKWPSSFGKSIPPIPPPQCEYGQSFVWLTLPVSRRDDIVAQIRLMQAHAYCVYDSKRSFAYRDPTTRQAAPPPTHQFASIQLSDVVYHVAKHSTWGKDIFQDGIVPLFGGSKCTTETWSRPSQPPTRDVSRVAMVSWAKPAIRYTEEQDHSKWAVSLDKTDPWVYIGDINAMLSQFHRGGGGVVIKDLDLWKAMSSLVSS